MTAERATRITYGVHPINFSRAFPICKQVRKRQCTGGLANGTLHYTVKGIHVNMKVTWNYTPPKGGGDTFTSIKKGSKATL